MRVEVESSENPCHRFMIIPELQQGEAEIISLVSLRTWDLRWSPTVTNKTELPTCLGVHSSGTTSTPNLQHHPLLPVPS